MTSMMATSSSTPGGARSRRSCSTCRSARRCHRARARSSSSIPTRRSDRAARRSRAGVELADQQVRRPAGDRTAGSSENVLPKHIAEGVRRIGRQQQHAAVGRRRCRDRRRRAAAHVVLPTPPLPPNSSSSVSLAGDQRRAAPRTWVAVSQACRVGDGGADDAATAGGGGRRRAGDGPRPRERRIRAARRPSAGIVAMLTCDPRSRRSQSLHRRPLEAAPAVTPLARPSRRRRHPVDDDAIDGDAVLAQRAKGVAGLLDRHGFGSVDPRQPAPRRIAKQRARPRACPSMPSISASAASGVQPPRSASTMIRCLSCMRSNTSASHSSSAGIASMRSRCPVGAVSTTMCS